LKKHFATYEVKSLEQMKHEDASLHKTVHGIARSAFLLMISFVAAADASLAASTTAYEISNSDTFCFDQHKNFTAGVDNLDLLLGKPTHLLGSTVDGTPWIWFHRYNTHVEFAGCIQPMRATNGLAWRTMTGSAVLSLSRRM